MIAGLIPMALSLAGEFAPTVAKWLGGDRAGEVAENVVGIAKKVTGQEDPANAMEVLRKDPQLALEYQRAVMDYQVRLEEEETKRMNMHLDHMNKVNETMQTEVREGRGWKAGWRPFNGYLFGISIFCDYFLSQIILAIIKAITMASVTSKTASAVVNNTLPASFTFDWVHIPESIYIFWALILGVSATSRGVEKVRKTQAYSGQTPMSFSAMAKKFTEGVAGK